MKILFRTNAFGILLLMFTGFAHAQVLMADTATVPQDWFLRDPERNHLQGVSSERVYETLLQGKPSRTVIVAVVDSGIDIDHEDLKSVIWTNEGEIPENGIDDDKNGYIDDVHGWNFIGGKNGNVTVDTYELTREYVRLTRKFQSVDPHKIPKKLKADYAQYTLAKDKFETLKSLNSKKYQFYKTLFANLTLSIDTLKTLLKTDSLTEEGVEEFTTNDPGLSSARDFLLELYKKIGPEVTSNDFIAQVKEYVDYYKVIVEYGYNENYNSREIVGDNYSDPGERIYGNNDVKGPDPSHGTHVAGIIGADRKNNLGIKGIADNVKIMSVRVVPNGDERDKDVANAILYAVDNGASIINMSFGKSYSPEKEVVDKAVRYAELKGVLLVHAAGNDSRDNDAAKNFPSRKYLDGKEAKNWLEIGASAWGENENFVGSFSNYGKKSVDFFAPGVEIHSTAPGNTYKSESGTSMACPATAGVAALLKSYFPELSATQVKFILEQSTRKFGNLKVQKPGGSGTVEFGQLSISGGMVNAFEAVKMAQEMKLQNKIK